MLNRSKIRDPRFWERWRHAGAIGSIKTARLIKRVIKAINNALGVEIIRGGESVLFIGQFGKEGNSEMVLTLAEVFNLLKSGLFKIPGVRGKILIETDMVRIWFKPTQGCDLVCLETQDFVNQLRQALYHPLA